MPQSETRKVNEGEEHPTLIDWFDFEPIVSIQMEDGEMSSTSHDLYINGRRIAGADGVDDFYDASGLTLGFCEEE